MRFVSALGFIFLASSATAGITPKNPTTFEPASDLAKVISGAISLSRDRIVFDNGEALNLTFSHQGKFINEGEIFKVSGETKSLLQGNHLCKAGDTPEFLSVVGVPSTKEINLRFYQADEGAESPGRIPCAVFNFHAPEEMFEAAVYAENAPAPVTDGDIGAWRIHKDTNPIDDTKTVTLALTATTGANQFGQEPVLLARCQSNQTEVFANWKTYLGEDSDGQKRIIVRIGEAPATNEYWGLSTDREAVFAPGWGGDMLKKMISSDRLVLQLTPYGENPITAVFNTTGLDVALKELADTCGWTY